MHSACRSTLPMKQWERCMRSGDTNWVHLRVIFDLIFFDPRCQCFDIVSGIIQTIGLGI